jgi:hypothetical protein
MVSEAETPRAARIAKNEAVFREVNERIERTAQDSKTSERFGFVCECGLENCLELIDLSIFEYERVRANPLYFFVSDGHEIESVEDVVERNADYNYNIVKKQGVGKDVARQTDPRSSGSA